jgi:hypothetical protein
MAYKLNQIVDEWLAERGLADNSWNRVYTNMVSGLRRFNLSTSGVPKVVQLTLDDADRAPLPSDYLQYSKIAFCLNGHMFALGLNNDLCLDLSFNDCGQPVANNSLFVSPNIGLSTGLVGTPFMVGDTQRNGEFIGRLFGIGSDNNPYGYYRIDKANNQILFSNLAQKSDIVMEYSADINAIDKDFDVHPYCVEAVKAWADWKLGKADKMHYLAEAKIMRLMFGKFTAKEWMAAAQSGQMAAPKA